MLRFRSLKNLAFQFLLLTTMLLVGSCATIAQSSKKPKPSDFGIKSKKALSFYIKGQAQAKYRDYRKAIEMYDEAILIEPKFGDAYFQAGACAYAIHDYDRAYPYLIKTKELEKVPNPMLFFFLGECAFHKDSFRVAVDNYNEFLSYKRATPAKIRKTTELHRKNAAFALQAMKKAIKFEPINMGDNVNSIGEEYLPNLTADGQTIFFTSRRPGCTGGYNAQYRDFTEDFYYSERVDGKWQPCKNLGPPVNTELNEGAASFSPDGQYVFFASCGRKSGYGDCDLYVSKLTGATWSPPQNLGPMINSPQWDSQPSISNDGKTLYFSSDGFSGYGSKDMFMSRRLDNTWTKWTKPQNLGPMINSANWDAYYSVPASGEFAYFSSENNAVGKTDIFRILLPKEMRPEPVVLIRGKVLDATTKQPISAKIFYELLSDGKELGIATSNPKTGEYTIILPAGEKYGFLAQAKGYMSENQNIDLTKIKEYKEISQDLLLVPIKKGESVVLNNIFFSPSNSKLTHDSKPELERVRKFLVDNATIKVEIAGHTNNACSEDWCNKLSTARAKAVYDYLAGKGIQRSRLRYKGYGSSKPRWSNSTADGMRKNRRVEFTILEI